jgi:hypothetical protein
LITFTGPVPECICMFSQLVVLVVQRCNVSGGFPFWVDSLVYLQELNLSGNYLTGTYKASAVLTRAVVQHRSLLLYYRLYRSTTREYFEPKGPTGAVAAGERLLGVSPRRPV